MSESSPPNEPLVVPNLAVVASNPEALSPKQVAEMTDEEAYEFAGGMVGAALGFIPGLGGVLGAAFSFLWNHFDPYKQGGVQDLLKKFHDKIIREVEKKIDLNNVQQLIKDGRTKLEGIQSVGNEFNKAYRTWEANDNKSTREQLRTEFTILKDLLLLLTPLYWDDGNAKHLAPLGCTISSMFFCLMRDAYFQGQKWGFDPGNIKDFHSTLSEHQKRVLGVLWSKETPDCRSISRFYRYVDPETPNGSRLNVHNANDTTSYKADEAHAFTVTGFFSGEKFDASFPPEAINAIVLSIFPYTASSTYTRSITFDRDGKFDFVIPFKGVLPGRPLIKINDLPYSWKLINKRESSNDFAIHRIPTVDKKITIEVERSWLYFTDFMFVPSDP